MNICERDTENCLNEISVPAAGDRWVLVCG